jgi:magnesium-transporting ATPase (P-type)
LPRQGGQPPASAPRATPPLSLARAHAKKNPSRHPAPTHPHQQPTTATVGVVTERNAERAIDELRAYEAATALVVRDRGQLRQIPAAELVPGDVVEVAVGAQVPADVRVSRLMSTVLRVDQSILTGESHSVDKVASRVGGGNGGGSSAGGGAAGGAAASSALGGRALYQDKINVLFSGTMVTSGRARGVVIGTGSATAIGRIRDAMTGDGGGGEGGGASNGADASTPLKKKLDEFGELLSKVIAGICVAVWVVNIGHFGDPALGGWLHGCIYYLKIAVALAVAAIPEGLPAVVTTCLALGTRKMARLNAIVRTLPSVETLGCTTVICSDKTGTLTTNQMSVVRVAALAAADGGGGAGGGGGGGGGFGLFASQQPPLPPASSSSSSAAVVEYEVSGTTYDIPPDAARSGAVRASAAGGGPPTALLPTPAAATPVLAAAALVGALCNDSVMTWQASSASYGRVGEATELALRVFAEKVGVPPAEGPAADALAAALGLPAAALLLPAAAEGAASAAPPSGLPPSNAHWAARLPRAAVLEFTRDRKMMSALVAPPSAAASTPCLLVCKGAPESVLSRCSHALVSAATGGGGCGGGGTAAARAAPMSDAMRRAVMERMGQYGGSAALRCLALAYKRMPAGRAVAGGGGGGGGGGECNGGPAVSALDEAGLTFVALVGMHDPPRREAAEAIEVCRAAGIRVVMVTGDNRATAEAVARQVGALGGGGGGGGSGGGGGGKIGGEVALMLPTSMGTADSLAVADSLAAAAAAPDDLEGGGGGGGVRAAHGNGSAGGGKGGSLLRRGSPSPPDPLYGSTGSLSALAGVAGGAGASGSGRARVLPASLTGAEFDALSREEKAEAAQALSVFSRVEPLHKLELVELLRAAGGVVAMTGDGVNDAPALVRADIGVAMGGGTAVAKAGEFLFLFGSAEGARRVFLALARRPPPPRPLISVRTHNTKHTHQPTRPLNPPPPPIHPNTLKQPPTWSSRTTTLPRSSPPCARGAPSTATQSSSSAT